MAIILKSKIPFMEEEQARKQYEKYMKQLYNGLLVLDDADFVHETIETQELGVIQGEGIHVPGMQERCDAVVKENTELKEELTFTKERLHHLLRSDFIRSFDAKDLKTGEYARDIQEADYIVKSTIVPIPVEKQHRFCRWF